MDSLIAFFWKMRQAPINSRLLRTIHTTVCQISVSRFGGPGTFNAPSSIGGGDGAKVDINISDSTGINSDASKAHVLQN